MELSKREKMKYAQALRRIDYGVWGYSPSLFYEITLTTRASHDQSTDRFNKDMKRLINHFRKQSYNLEYCGCYELSPKNDLLHWHGLFRVKGGYFPISRRQLGDLWNKFHGAFAVSIESVKSMEEMKKYISKHIVKEFISERRIRNKFLVSRGWCRPYIKELMVEFKRWWVNGCEIGSWLSVGGYRMMNKVVKTWCEKRFVYVDSSFGWFKAKGRMIDSEIYNFGG